MSDVAYVASLPDCDFHTYGAPGVDAGQSVPAAYDAATTLGPWANLCEECFARFGQGLGTGRGQRLVVGERPRTTREDVHAAIERGASFDEIEDLIGDGDPADYL